MNLSELVTEFYNQWLETASNSRFTSTQVKSWINEGYKKVLDMFKWQTSAKEFRATNVYTLCSDAGDSTGTALYVDSSSGMTAGMFLWVYDTTNYERVQIESISSNTITLVSPGLVGTYTDGDYVAGAQIYLPWDCYKVETIMIEENTTSDHQAQILNPMEKVSYRIAYPLLKSSGMPTAYTLMNKDFTEETGLTADANTSTTTVIDSALTGAEDDYYVGWKLINTTRNASSRISDYASSTKTITLYDTITSQAEGDSYKVTRAMLPIQFDTIPDAQYTYWIQYFGRYGLVNDYDEPVFDERFHDVLINWALYRASKADRYSTQPERISMFLDSFKSSLQALKDNEWYPTDGSISFRNVNDIYNSPTVETIYGR